MKTWIALLRGVNVSGRNKLPMKVLVAELEGIGLSGIQTYIQSGNVVFRGPSKSATVLGKEIGKAIDVKFGFTPDVTIISSQDLAATVAANPFHEAANDADGKALHFFFLARAPSSVDHDRLESVRRSSERWQLKGSVLYLYTPEGFGDSKLASQIEKILGVSSTARNWRTVNALLELAANPD
jgi:uncharacterized protein (DUF1697 family)